MINEDKIYKIVSNLFEDLSRYKASLNESFKSNILPADYHPAFVSLIKHSLNEFSKELYSKYYEKNHFTQKNSSKFPIK